MNTKTARSLMTGLFTMAGLTVITMIILWAAAIIVGSPTLGALGALCILLAIIFGGAGGIVAFQLEDADDEYWRSYARTKHEREIENLKKNLEDSEARYEVALDRLKEKEKNCICKDLETKK